MARGHVLDLFHASVREWFAASFPSPTRHRSSAGRPSRAATRRLFWRQRQRQDAGGVPLWPESVMFEPRRRRSSAAGSLRLPTKGTRRRRGAHLRAPLAASRMPRAIGDNRSMCPKSPSVPEIRPPSSERASAANRRTPSSQRPSRCSASHLERAARLTLVDTVIIDEIHALVPSKRGTHSHCRWSG
jgi:ATP-dependent Lhr-like helicase